MVVSDEISRNLNPTLETILDYKEHYQDESLLPSQGVRPFANAVKGLAQKLHDEQKRLRVDVAEDKKPPNTESRSDIFKRKRERAAEIQAQRAAAKNGNGHNTPGS